MLELEEEETNACTRHVEMFNHFRVLGKRRYIMLWIKHQKLVPDRPQICQAGNDVLLVGPILRAVASDELELTWSQVEN